MKKNSIGIIVIIIVVVALIGGLIYYLGQSRVGSDDGAMMADDQTAGGAEQGTLLSLLASGQPQNCNFSVGSGTAAAVGTAYINGGKMRTDVAVKQGDVDINSHAVIMDNFVYTWTDGMPTGYKIAVATDSEKAANSGAPFDVNQKIDYKCKPAASDESKFDLPANIQFMDFQANVVPGEVTPINANGAKVNCAICDQAPEDQQAACRKALGC